MLSECYSYEELLIESMLDENNSPEQTTPFLDANEREIPSYRPADFESFIGQEHIKGTLKLLIRAAKNKEKPLNHILFYGGAGLGKTTLAGIIAKQMESKLHIINARAVQGVMDLLYALSEIDWGDVLFIDEIHGLPMPCQEILYEAMEDFEITVPATKDIAPQRAKLPEFTLLGATTLLGDVSKPMLDRFVLKLELRPYSIEELAEMAITKGISMGIDVDVEAALEIAQRCRGTARYVTNYLRIASDIGWGMECTQVNKDVANTVFQVLQIDKLGLESKDYRYLELLSVSNPMGLNAISLNLNESTNTVERLIEPYLQRLGLIKRQSRGRVLTERGARYLANKHNNF